MAQGDATIVFQDQENIAGGQVGLFQLQADVVRQVGDFQRHRLAVEQTHALDLGHQAAFLELQALGHGLRCRDMLEAAQAVEHFVTHLGHRLGQALQGRYVLKGLGFGDKGALAVDLEDQAFLLQVTQRLAHGDAADVEGLAQLMLRRHAPQRRIGAVKNACAQQFLELGIERNGGKGEKLCHGVIVSRQLVITRYAVNDKRSK
ncbi:hypothetical protein D9M71_597250 [compost metagenome]